MVELAFFEGQFLKQGAESVKQFPPFSRLPGNYLPFFLCKSSPVRLQQQKRPQRRRIIFAIIQAFGNKGICDNFPGIFEKEERSRATHTGNIFQYGAHGSQGRVRIGATGCPQR